MTIEQCEVCGSIKKILFHTSTYCPNECETKGPPWKHIPMSKAAITMLKNNGYSEAYIHTYAGSPTICSGDPTIHCKNDRRAYYVVKKSTHVIWGTIWYCSFCYEAVVKHAGEYYSFTPMENMVVK